jgi:hypothetical protein
MAYYFVIDRTAKKYVQDTSVPTIFSTDSIKMNVFSAAATSLAFTNKDGSVSKPTLMNVQFTAPSSYYFMDIEFPLGADSGASTTTLFD